MIKQRDFVTFEISGTTHSSANTKMLFRHGREQVPWTWDVLEGRVYVPRHGATPNFIDVRSSESAEPFRILLYYN